MYKPQPYILLIDDDTDDLEMFSSALKMKNIMVKTFDSAAKALFYLMLRDGDMELPSLIILDYNMPKKNGQQVLEEIKGNKSIKGVPVVMYSTGMSEILKAQLLVAGALDCIDKPWTQHELNCQAEKFHELAFAF